MSASPGYDLRAWRPRQWPAWLWAAASGRHGRLRQVAWWLVVLLVTLRLLAPFILTAVANANLAKGEQVRGHVDGLSLSLLRSAYAVHGLDLQLRQRDGTWVPLLAAETIRCDLEWAPLLRGELVGSLAVHAPVFHFFLPEPPATPAPPPPKEPQEPLNESAGEPPEAPWAKSLRTVVRARLTEMTIDHGQVVYHDRRHDLSCPLTRVTAHVTDLVIPRPARTHRCHFTLALTTPGQGAFSADGEVNLLAREPTFLVKAKLEEVRLPELNALTVHLDNLTFTAGTFSAYCELVGDGRRLGGYVKALFHDLDIATYGEEKDGFTAAFVKLLIKAAEEILENTELHQHGARIPLRGPLGAPGTDVWTALATALSNAFVRALTPGYAH